MSARQEATSQLAPKTRSHWRKKRLQSASSCDMQSELRAQEEMSRNWELYQADLVVFG